MPIFLKWFIWPSSASSLPRFAIGFWIIKLYWLNILLSQCPLKFDLNFIFHILSAISSLFFLSPNIHHFSFMKVILMKLSKITFHIISNFNWVSPRSPTVPIHLHNHRIYWPLWIVKKLVLQSQLTQEPEK